MSRIVNISVTRRLISEGVSVLSYCLRIALIICGFMCLIGFFGALFINENLWYIAPMAYGLGIIIICILAMFAGKNK